MKSNWWLAIIVVLGMACDSSVVFESNQAIEEGIWTHDNSVDFEFYIEDTVSLHNFFINLRNGNGYPYSNIYMFVEMDFPNGKRAVDTLECFLADPAGNWYGSGLGDIYDNRFIYKRKKAFPIPGNYKVAIHHAMREDTLNDILDVGFRVSLND